MTQAEAFIIPGIDDFGLSSIQANYFGTPAVINHQSGAAEVITDGRHGVHIHKLSLSGVKKALNKALNTNFDPNLLQTNANRLNSKNFVQSFTNQLSMLL